MEIKDFNLIEYRTLNIKIGKTLYKIETIPAKIELELLQKQMDNVSKLSTSKYTESDLVKWKSLIKRLFKHSCEFVNDSDIDSLDPLKVVGLMNLIYIELAEKAKIVSDMYSLSSDDDTKKKVMK